MNDKVITEEVIKEASFSAVKLREMGFNETQMKNAGFDSGELREAGYNATQLRCAGFSPEQLRLGGFTLMDVSSAGFGHNRLMRAGFTAIEMKEDLQLTLEQLIKAGFQAVHLKAVGFRAFELKAAGFLAKQLRQFFIPEGKQNLSKGSFFALYNWYIVYLEILRCGYSKNELKPLGLWPHDGEWQHYNQYWSCCFSLNKKGKFCAGTDNID